eukprot:1845368-Rhodomonas_salina.2
MEREEEEIRQAEAAWCTPEIMDLSVAGAGVTDQGSTDAERERARVREQAMRAWRDISVHGHRIGGALGAGSASATSRETR